MTNEPIYLFGFSLTGWLIMLVYVHLVVWWLIRYRHVIRDVLQGVMDSLPARKKARRLSEVWDAGYKACVDDHGPFKGIDSFNPYRRQ